MFKFNLTNTIYINIRSVKNMGLLDSVTKKATKELEKQIKNNGGKEIEKKVKEELKKRFKF